MELDTYETKKMSYCKKWTFQFKLNNHFICFLLSPNKPYFNAMQNFQGSLNSVPADIK